VDDPETDRFWASSEHEGSRRTAIIADEGESVWLYLTEADSPTIENACWLFNCVPAPTEDEVEAHAADYETRGVPAPAAREFVDEAAQLEGRLESGQARFRWSDDGEAVAAWIDDELVGFLVAGDPNGYSAHLLVGCEWGEPLDAELYAGVFGLPGRDERAGT
jgi:hypothetical protein